MGGGSSKSTSTTQTTQIDKRLVVADEGLGISSDSSTVNISTLDAGAFESAAMLARDGLLVTNESVADVIGLARDFFSGSFELLTENQKLIKASNDGVREAFTTAQQVAESPNQGVLVAAALAAVAVVAVRSFGR